MVSSFSGVFQIAYVVRDMDRAVEMFASAHGVSGFGVAVYDLNLSFPATSTSLKVALVWVGDHEIELIEPIADATGVFAPHVPTAPALVAFHHMCMRVPGDDLADWDRFRATIADEQVVLAGSREGMRFIYTDERATLGHYLEYVWMSPTFLVVHPWRMPPSLR